MAHRSSKPHVRLNPKTQIDIGRLLTFQPQTSLQGTQIVTTKNVKKAL